jgi:hypothetical protein
MKKLYIGYDLGDGETIVNLVIYDTNDIGMGIACIHDVKMPSTSAAGKAIPTLFAQDMHTNNVLLAQDIINNSPDKIKNISSILFIINTYYFYYYNHYHN